MTEDVEERLRDGLRNAPLPAAPETLRNYLADLPLEAQIARAERRPARRSVLLGAAAIAILALAIGTMVLSGSLPAVTPTPTGPRPGFHRFEAPGMTFDYPGDWTDQSIVDQHPTLPGTRFVGLLARRLSLCPLAQNASPKPTTTPGSCRFDASPPGSMILTITEYEHQYPGVLAGEVKTTIAGYPVWVPAPPSEPPDAANSRWSVQAPDGGLYVFVASAPPTDSAARQADLETLLGTLRLSPWEASPQANNGLVHMDLPEGFSFDYPAGWTVYYPHEVTTVGYAVVTVASVPVGPPCADDWCQRFTTPPGTVAIEFWVGSSPVPPRWSDARLTVGGQPAFRQDWGSPNNATGADEGHTWTVRLNDPSTLDISVSLRGPDLPGLRAAVDEVLGSVRITQLPSPAPSQASRSLSRHPVGSGSAPIV
jgi:hypothetical protein